jgi:integrase/recombinase XerD
MSIRLIKVKKSPYWHIRGTHCGRTIFQSTKLTDKQAAEAYRLKIENQIQDRHVYGAKHSVTFSMAAELHLNAGGSKRYLTPILERCGLRFVRDLKQHDIDTIANELYPNCSNSTKDRQAYSPFIAVMNYAARSDFCEYRKWKRPKKGEKTRQSRYATYEEIRKFHEKAAKHIKPLIVLLCYAGLRMGEAINLQWI